MHSRSRTRQQGAVIVTGCLMLRFLLGTMSFALDLGRLFVVKSELQTALDSCALSGAQELDGTASALTRATSAGIMVGNLNRVNFQSANWGGQGRLVAGDISFRAVNYTTTTTPAAARYDECTHAQHGV